MATDNIKELQAINESVQKVNASILGLTAETKKPEPPSGADKEKSNEDNRKHKNLMGMFGDMKKGIVGMGSNLKGMLGKMGGMAKAGASGLMGMLKKGAMMLAIPALIAFMQSPMFDKLKKMGCR